MGLAPDDSTCAHRVAPGRMMFRNPNKFRLRLPPDWLFVNRLQFGLLSVLVWLGARGDWARLFRRAVESPTEPLAAQHRPA